MALSDEYNKGYVDGARDGGEWPTKVTEAEQKIRDLEYRNDLLRAASPDNLRGLGWTVAIHNDYRLGGKPHTFWLLTKDTRFAKGEGETDAEALDEIRTSILRFSEYDAAVQAVIAHLSELEGAWRRGVFEEHDGGGGTRSNRNVEVLRRLERAVRPPEMQKVQRARVTGAPGRSAANA